MPRPLLAALVAIPLWSALALALVRLGGRRLAWGTGLLLALLLAAWGASRVGTANPISRTARWDQWLFLVMALALLVPPAVAVPWGVADALGRPLPAPAAVGLGALAGLAALPVAFVLAVAIEVLWPH